MEPISKRTTGEGTKENKQTAKTIPTKNPLEKEEQQVRVNTKGRGAGREEGKTYLPATSF
jgi:hypothetical protein